LVACRRPMEDRGPPRRVTMQQLGLDLLESPAPPAQVWEALSKEQRAELVAALARLIAQAAGHGEDDDD
ncbi:MAG TPA: hypothetical protein VG476_03800, partial [Acidimicrobiales bacterium]|nr:hypothetical protein [Acidimicrobiales bacterium]